MGFLSWILGSPRASEDYGTQSVTLTGQPVRSKAERVIADYLTRHNLAYQYESEARTNYWLGLNSKIIRPDFYLPQYGIYVEYWGLVDSPNIRTKDNYIKSMKWKMAQYRNNNIPFVSIYPWNLSSLDYHFRKKFREVKGFELPDMEADRRLIADDARLMDEMLQRFGHRNRVDTQILPGTTISLVGGDFRVLRTWVRVNDYRNWLCGDLSNRTPARAARFGKP